MTVTHSGPSGIAPPGSSGIKVIIVGLGLAGLTAAIECHRKGHSVIGLEKTPKPTHLGDIFSISSNGALVISKWDDGVIARELDSVRCDVDTITVWDEYANVKLRKDMNGYKEGEGLVLNRSTTVTTLYEYGKSLGIDLRFGVSVSDYWEDDEQAGVIVDGERFSADCVIASDGIHSKARPIITRDTRPLTKSGAATYRAGYPAEVLKDHPKAQWVLEGTEKADQLNHFIGKDIAVIIGTGRHGKDVYWGCLHRSNDGVSKSWLQPSDVTKALLLIEDWPAKEKVGAVIRCTPNMTCFDHLVMAVDPLTGWVSKKGRMIVIGDAAHAFIPTSGQGASQSIEDGAVVAICLELAGKNRIPLALQVMQKLRYERISLIGDGSAKMLESLHMANWDAKQQDKLPTLIARAMWIFDHDCQKSTYEEFSKAAEAVITGGPYLPANIATDGRYGIVEEEGKSTVKVTAASVDSLFAQ
ncbi:Monooxygenase FAD-binding [Penicillium malachiteum]|uniref:Monooxygenase FAD-binding n=1 Tax=Penicillium malachiteum TaxID=1324776 RepID=UPI00254864D1|nr:Monooxygenase FAD-binding [Penicillium malachiteum]KAJ5715325.1 Monooxygenase FAD-binding [Penicillium malachiteum]